MKQKRASYRETTQIFSDFSKQNQCAMHITQKADRLFNGIHFQLHIPFQPSSSLTMFRTSNTQHFIVIRFSFKNTKKIKKIFSFSMRLFFRFICLKDVGGNSVYGMCMLLYSSNCLLSGDRRHTLFLTLLLACILSIALQNMFKFSANRLEK